MTNLTNNNRGTNPNTDLKNEPSESAGEPSFSPGAREELLAGFPRIGLDKAQQMTWMAQEGIKQYLQGGVLNQGIDGLMGNSNHRNHHTAADAAEGPLNNHGLQQMSRQDLSSVAGRFNATVQGNPAQFFAPPYEGTFGATTFPGGYPKAIVDRDNRIEVIFTATPNGNDPVRMQKNY